MSIEMPAATSRSAPQSGPRVLSSGWLVSFGDLLTLLLAFFVASIAAAGGVTKQTQRVKAVGGDSASGTRVAAEPAGDGSVRSADTWFRMEDLEPDGEFAAAKLAVLEELVQREDLNSPHYLVTVCTAPWNGHAVPALALGTQLVRYLSERGVPPAQLKLRLTGGTCGSVGVIAAVAT